MLAMRFEPDVAQQDDLVVASDFFKGPLQIVTGILEITGIPFFVCTSDASGCSDQPFAIGIVAGPANERAHRAFGLRARGPNDRRLSRFDDLIHVNPSRHLGVLRPSCETIRPLCWLR